MKGMGKRVLLGAAVVLMAASVMLLVERAGAAAGAFVQQGKLEASDGAAQDNLGFSVAVSGDTAVVGAPRDQVGSTVSQGSAYVYVRNGTTWTFQQKLTASDGVANDEFGYAVAIAGDTIFVGRHFTQVGNNARTRGAVYVYTRTGTTWAQSGSQLTPSDAADGDLFGSSLAVDAGTLVVGALQKNNGSTFFQGAAYVFTGSGATWAQQAKLTANDGGFANFFGVSVAVSGDTAVVGATGQAGISADSGRGAAYVFNRSGSSWTQQQKLLASDGAAGDAFGFSVGVSGDTAVVGARLDTVGPVGGQGSVYVFTRAGTTWSEQQHLFGVEATQRNDTFGGSVAVGGDTIAVGAPAHEVVPGIANHGAVYIFTRAGTVWTRQQKLIHSDLAPDALGTSVALDGSTVVAGAPSKNSSRGAAYVFTITTGTTPTPTATPTPTGTVQFTTSTVQADEGPGGSSITSGVVEWWQAVNAAAAGSASLTVTRTDATQAATVDYATVDGTASARNDYTAVFGTLRFAAGETSKSIVVHVTDDRFQESVESFSVVLSNPVGVNLGSPSSATVQVTSDDAATGPNPVADASFDVDFFVRQHYADFLGREADAAGLQFWKDEITQCETRTEAERQGCREVKRVNVSAAFFLSIEFQQTGYFVYLLHQAAFASGERLGSARFLADAGEVRRGIVVGAQGWEEQLAANKQAFALAFVQRPEFTAAYPASLTPAQFVDGLNANAGGSLSQAERDARVAELTADNTAAGRASVLLKLTDDAEFRRREFNKAFVLMQYFGYLRRAPNESPDSNFDGYNFWLGKLNEFNGNFVNAEMVKAFITSIEYRQRFGP
jgi:hypothetical protein